MNLRALLLLSLAVLASAEIPYHLFHVLKVAPQTPFQVERLRQFLDWNNHFFFVPPNLNTPSLVAVRDWNVPGFLKSVEEYLCLDVETVTENLQTWLDTERVAEPNDTMSWDRYHGLDAIYDFLQGWEKRAPGLVSTFPLGVTSERRPILALQIEADPQNPWIFVESNFHAREWISSATATWIINELLTSEDPQVRNLRETVNWVFVPVANPDGFHYSHVEDRLWAKTRRQTSDQCRGADPSRNFPYLWKQGGVSESPCGVDFAGSSTLSEIEAASVANYMNKHARKFTAYLSFHSNAQKLLYPYASSKHGLRIRNEDEYRRVGEKMVEALAKRYGTQYELGDVLTLGFETSGTPTDWVKAVHDIPFVWQYEFRTNGTGFIYPSEGLVGNAEETLDSLVAMVAEARELGYFL